MSASYFCSPEYQVLYLVQLWSEPLRLCDCELQHSTINCRNRYNKSFMG